MTELPPPRGPERRRRWPWLLLPLACLSVAGAQPSSSPAPPEARRHNNLGVALMDAGTKDPKYFGEAVREFEAAIRLAPRYAVARLNLGLALYYAAQPQRADVVLREVSRQDPRNLHALYVLGLLREHEGQFGAAAALFRRVVEADPEDPDAWYHLGFCLGKANQPREAVEPLRRAAVLVPYQRRVRYGLYVALSRAGHAEEAQAELERFRALDGSQIRVVDGPKNLLEYLKQGTYAEAIADSAGAAAPAPQPEFVDATSELGFASSAPLPAAMAAVLSGQATPPAFFANAPNRRRLAAALAASVAIADLDKDGRLDVVYVRGLDEHGVFLQRARDRFTRVTLAPAVQKILAGASALAAGDLDNDGWIDLVVAGIGRIAIVRNVEGRLTPGPALGQLSAALVPAAVTLADLDHDGDLDIAVAGGVRLDASGSSQPVRFPASFAPHPNLVLRNNANGTFADIAAPAGLDGGGTPTRAFWFSDLDDDRAVDAVLVDMDGGRRVFLNRKDGTFAPSAAVTPPILATQAPGEARASGDLNGDGAIDEVHVTHAGLRVRRNARRPANWLTVRLTGYAVPGKVKSNALGIGARVEVRSAGRWERRELRAGNGAGGSDAPELTFDLGADARLDFVRAVFPSGVRRTLTDVAANEALTIDEPLLDVNSCPTLFTWNGERFTFITDTLSAGILGELVAPGQYWTPDDDEWVRIEGPDLVARADGALEVRFTNPLEEVTYLDQVRLMAVDHPASVTVHSDERMVGRLENRRQPRAFAVSARRPIARAIDQHGHDVTDRLRARDRRFFDHFERRPFKGFAGEWSLTLDLGPMPAGTHPVLGVHAWSYWNSSAAVVAASQAGEGLYGPALDVLDAAGRWRTATDDLGLPAGLPREVLVDLAPVLRHGERVVRIRSNRTIYYDEAWVGEAVAQAPLEAPGAVGPLRLHEVPLRRAELRWLGYPHRVLPDGELPEIFDYEDVRQDAEWGTHAGSLTRYGRVEPLLAARDDRLVIMGHGEEAALVFDGQVLPPVEEGWARTWYFYGSGFEKGYELYSAHAETIEPLPYHAMGRYPYDGAAAPRDQSYLEYLLEWNTRPAFMRGHGAGGAPR